MNPFFILLILVPFLLAVLFSLILVGSVIEKGFVVDYLAGIALMAGISIYLGRLLKNNLSDIGGAFEFPDSQRISEREKSRLGAIFLSIAYVVIGLGGIVVFNYYDVKGVLGVLGFLMGITLLLSGVAIKTSRKQIVESIDYKLARSWYPRNQAIYFVLIGVFGVLIYMMFRFLPNWKIVSVWDIAGVLFLLLSSCLWLFLSESRRMPRKTR